MHTSVSDETCAAILRRLSERYHRARVGTHIVAINGRRLLGAYYCCKVHGPLLPGERGLCDADEILALLAPFEAFAKLHALNQ